MHVYVVLNYCCCRCYACAGVGVSTIENVDGVVVIDDDVDTHVAAADGIHVVAVDAADVDGVVVDVTNVVLTAVVVVVSFARDYNVAAMDNDVTGANVANAIDVDVIVVGDIYLLMLLMLLVALKLIMLLLLMMLSRVMFLVMLPLYAFVLMHLYVVAALYSLCIGTKYSKGALIKV